MSSATTPLRERINRPTTTKIFFFVILAIGAALRLIGFPNIPNGFNQDEISAGYESWSLFHYGTQSWGDRFPVYFSSGGAGQNVLYSYLNMPFMGLFGLDNPLGTRLLEVLIGIGTLPLLYILVRRLYTKPIALAAMFLTAVIPWHWMLSRWGLESNILPFVVLLGAYLITVALQTRKTWVTVISLIPLALACYAYGIACVPIAVFVILLLLIHHREILSKWRAWLVALILFAVVAAPFALFIGKTYLHLHYPFEQALPFSLPELNHNRLADLQRNQTPAFPTSVYFVLLNGSNEHTPWNGLPVGSGDPFPSIFVFFALAEIFRRLFIALKNRKLQITKLSVIDIWAISSITIWFLIPVDLNETNIIYLPVIVLAASFCLNIIIAIPRLAFKVIAILVVAVIAASTLIQPVTTYFSPSYNEFTSSNFNPGFGPAIEAVRTHAAGQPVYVTNLVFLNYLQTLWYLKIPAAEFQKYNPTYANPDFENFIFARKQLDTTKPYWYMLRSVETAPCGHPINTQTIDTYWHIGQCIPAA